MWAVLSPGNLPFTATEAEILKFLSLPDECPVEIVSDMFHPARRLGFGFVTVPTEKVEAVLTCNGGLLSGRRVKGEDNNPHCQSLALIRCFSVAVAKLSEQKPAKWQEVQRSGASVMHSKPSRGICDESVFDERVLSVQLRQKEKQCTSGPVEI